MVTLTETFGGRVFLLIACMDTSHASAGSGNPYQEDVFAPESIPEDWWIGNVTHVLPLPMSRIECSIHCMVLTLEVCNAYFYNNVDGCTLGQLDYVPMSDPPLGYSTIVIQLDSMLRQLFHVHEFWIQDVHVRLDVDRINRTNCLPDSPCTINEGHCGYDEDCGHGLKCGKKEFNYTCTSKWHSVSGCLGFDLIQLVPWIYRMLTRS